MSNSGAELIGMTGKIERQDAQIEENSGHLTEYLNVMLNVPRLSGTMDELPVHVQNNLLVRFDLKENMAVKVKGHVRTRDYRDSDGKPHVEVYCLAGDIEPIEKEEIEKTKVRNHVLMTGTICRVPVYRETRSGRNVTDLMIAVTNREEKDNVPARTSYIPCIAWGLNAAAAKKLKPGDVISLEGRFQSRKYRKSSDNYTVEHTAREISITSYRTLEKDDESSD